MNSTRCYFLVLALLGLFLCLPASSKAADVLMKDGTVFSGKIIGDNPTFLVFELEDGTLMTLQREQVSSIFPEGMSKDGYPVLGSTFGFPAFFNLTGGYYEKEWGFKVNGGYWGALWGAQLDLSKTLYGTKNFLLNFSLVTGYLEAKSGITDGGRSIPNWGYGGVGLDLNWGGFEVEADVISGPFGGQVSFPLQVGYVQRFN